MAESELRMGELVALLALAQDNAFGQPLDSRGVLKRHPVAFRLPPYGLLESDAIHGG
jgi:hypothetical protein